MTLSLWRYHRRHWRPIQDSLLGSFRYRYANLLVLNPVVFSSTIYFQWYVPKRAIIMTVHRLSRYLRSTAQQAKLTWCWLTSERPRGCQSRNYALSSPFIAQIPGAFPIQSWAFRRLGNPLTPRQFLPCSSPFAARHVSESSVSHDRPNLRPQQAIKERVQAVICIHLSYYIIDRMSAPLDLNAQSRDRIFQHHVRSSILNYTNTLEDKN